MENVTSQAVLEQSGREAPASPQPVQQRQDPPQDRPSDSKEIQQSQGEEKALKDSNEAKESKSLKEVKEAGELKELKSVKEIPVAAWGPPARSKSPAPPSEKSCKCLKSRCLRLNCSCFNGLGYCGEQCLCAGCLNVPFHDEERNFVIDKTVAINRLAFKPKLRFLASSPNLLGEAELDNEGKLMVSGKEGKAGEGESATRLTLGSEAELGVGQAIYSRGCKCSKSRCQSRHCECFKNGLDCTNICKCDHCGNGFVELDKRDIGKYYEKDHRKRFKLIIPKRVPKALKPAQPDEECVIKFVKFK